MQKNPLIPCYHCGEDCNPQPILFDEKNFCCSGCTTVYEILSQSPSCEYYNLQDHPGIKVKESELGKRYAFLELDDIRKKLLEFSDGGISKVRLFIPAIHCSSCIWLLENLHRFEKGIIQSTVNFTRKEITITFREEEISLRKVVELLASVHYIPQLNMGSLQEKNARQANHSIYIKLGIAGFCFGNIMLFSFPEYLSVDDSVENMIRENLRWLNLLFALPVAFYSGSDYLISAWKGLRKRQISIDVPIALGILALFGRSAFDIITGVGSGFMDSLAGLIFFLLIGRWYQSKSYSALSFERDYQSYFPISASVIEEDGSERLVSISNVKAGMRILVRNRELIPADAILVKGDGNIDYSFVSGESSPIHKESGERVFAGGKQMGTAIELIIEKEVSQSYLTELWNQDTAKPSNVGHLDTYIQKISRNFTLAVVIIAIGAGSTWLYLDPSQALNVFTSILIVACPCALALTLPFAFGSTMRIFGRNGFYLKKTDVVETLAKTHVIVFDKTGTLTQNDKFELDFSFLNAQAAELGLIRSLVKQSTHPSSTAIYNSLSDKETEEVGNFQERISLGIEGEIRGRQLKLGSAVFTGTADAKPLVSGSKVFVNIDGYDLGFILLKNKYREGMRAVMQSLGQENELHLLSGDNDSEAEALLPIFGTPGQLKFNQSPHDKLHYIRNLKAAGNRVLMVGDGLNDAGALLESNAGITIADNVYHFSPACDAILDSKKFHQLSDFLNFTRTSMRIVKASLFVSLAYNITGVTIACMGLMTPLIAAILMPLSSVTVVAFVTISTRILAQRSGMEVNAA
ncbi:MAG: heavy metal translocating P-type ATPase metal-binding domain-containing protein [Bacteroidota bacterium]